jgi:excisionase family DNA binding protein
VPKKTPTQVPEGVEYVSYDTLAQLLGVKVETVRSLAARGRLPKPAYRVGNSPLFAAADVNDLLQNRRQGTGGPGHPSRLELNARSAAKNAAFADRVRAAVASPESKVSTLRELASKIGLNGTTLNNRLESRARWSRAELTQLEKILGPLGEPDNVIPPPARRTAAKGSPRKTSASKAAARSRSVNDTKAK